MRFKKFEKPHKNAKFQAKRAVMKQDETVKTQIPTMKSIGGEKKTAAAPSAAAAPAEKIDFSQVKVEPIFEELVGKTAIAIVNLPPRKMMGISSEGMLISAVHEQDGREGLNLLMVDDRIPAGAKLY